MFLKEIMERLTGRKFAAPRPLSSTTQSAREVRPKLIYDIGMHIGQDTAFYLAKGFDVVAIEANPLLAEEGKKKFASFIKDGRLRILNVGIGAAEGEFPFYVNETLSHWSSFDKEIATREGTFYEINVKCFKLEKILSEFGMPYYLKVDIEGADHLAIKSLYAFKERPIFVSVENGNGGLLETLCDLGYSSFKFINQATIQLHRCPFPPREGIYVDYRFEHGASGLFGEETEGVWKSYKEVSVEINAYWNNPNRDPNIHGWFDLHAKQ